MSDSFQRLPPTLQQLLLLLHHKLVFAHEPVPSTKSICLLMQNLNNHSVPNTLIFEENMIWWYPLLLDQEHTDNTMGFDNSEFNLLLTRTTKQNRVTLFHKELFMLEGLYFASS